MVTITVLYRSCHQTKKVIKAGKTSAEKPRYHCRNCRQYFQLEYFYNACKPGITELIVFMALNGSGVNNTVRVLKVGMNTVLQTLKKSEPCVSKWKAIKGSWRNYSFC